MRVIECNECGETVSAANDEELAGRLAAHLRSEHDDRARRGGGRRPRPRAGLRRDGLLIQSASRASRSRRSSATAVAAGCDRARRARSSASRARDARRRRPPRRRGRRARALTTSCERRRRGRSARRRRRRPSRAGSRRCGRPRGRPGGGPARCRGAPSSSPGRKPRPGRRRGAPDEVRDAPLEPAHRAGAEAGEHDARLPRLAQDRVEPLGAPDRQQVDHRAAADVDRVLRQQVLAQRHRLAAEPEQRDVRRLAQAVAVRLVEAADLVLGVAARGGEQAEPRARRPVRRRTSSSSAGSAEPAVKPPPPIARIVGVRPPVRRQGPAPRRPASQEAASPARSRSRRHHQA